MYPFKNEPFSDPCPSPTSPPPFETLKQQRGGRECRAFFQTLSEKFKTSVRDISVYTDICVYICIFVGISGHDLESLRQPRVI